MSSNTSEIFFFETSQIITPAFYVSRMHQVARKNKHFSSRPYIGRHIRRRHVQKVIFHWQSQHLEFFRRKENNVSQKKKEFFFNELSQTHTHTRTIQFQCVKIDCIF